MEELEVSKLSDVCPFKLNEIYEILYELSDKLGIRNEFYTNVSRGLSPLDERDKLQELLDASKRARDNLMIWYHKQTLMEIHVTISLLTAKIRFIEYKLGLCEALDLHQTCSIALVDFTNVISQMTNHSLVKKSKTKTMSMVLNEVDLPVWLSHYRNIICHAPVESPNISILVSLIMKSLHYMNESLWSKVLNVHTFNARNCLMIIEFITSCTNVMTMNQHFSLRDEDLGKKKSKVERKRLTKCQTMCTKLRNMAYRHPHQVVEMVIQYITRLRPLEGTRNCALLLEQIILVKGCFEKFVFKLLYHVKQNPADKLLLKWFWATMNVVSYKPAERAAMLKKSLKKLNMNMSIKIIRFTNIPPVKCCHLAYELIKLDEPWVPKFITRLRFKLYPVLGKQKTMILIRMTRLAYKDKPNEPDENKNRGRKRKISENI